MIKINLRNISFFNQFGWSWQKWWIIFFRGKTHVQIILPGKLHKMVPYGQSHLLLSLQLIKVKYWYLSWFRVNLEDVPNLGSYAYYRDLLQRGQGDPRNTSFSPLATEENWPLNLDGVFSISSEEPHLQHCTSLPGPWKHHLKAW